MKYYANYWDGHNNIDIEAESLESLQAQLPKNYTGPKRKVVNSDGDQCGYIGPVNPKFDCRYLMVKDVLYIRAEDVAAWVKHIVATEETDVRWRFNEAVESLIRPQVPSVDKG